MRSGGFTLVEFVLVMVLLIIMTAVAVPRFTAVQSLRVNAAARGIASDIRYAQSLAISAGKNHRVVFSAGGYTIEENAGGWQYITFPVTADNFIVQIAADYEGVVIDSSYTVEFNSLGEPVVGGGGSFTVSNGGANPCRQISIVNNIGRVQIGACP